MNTALNTPAMSMFTAVTIGCGKGGEIHGH